MKISIWLACLLLCVSSISLAQTIGFRAGLNIASQTWKYEGIKIRPGPILGSHLGITLNFGESEKVSGQLELSYSRLGVAEYSDSTGTVPAQNIDYLKLGCAMKFYIKENLNIHLGPELGFGFRSASDLTGLRAPDFGAFIGSEYYFTNYLGAGVRYFFGFSDINDNPEVKQFNRAFQISILIRGNSRQLKEMGY